VLLVSCSGDVCGRRVQGGRRGAGVLGGTPARPLYVVAVCQVLVTVGAASDGSPLGDGGSSSMPCTLDKRQGCEPCCVQGIPAKREGRWQEVGPPMDGVRLYIGLAAKDSTWPFDLSRRVTWLQWQECCVEEGVWAREMVTSIGVLLASACLAALAWWHRGSRAV